MLSQPTATSHTDHGNVTQYQVESELQALQGRRRERTLTRGTVLDRMAEALRSPGQLVFDHGGTVGAAYHYPAQTTCLVVVYAEVDGQWQLCWGLDTAGAGGPIGPGRARAFRRLGNYNACGQAKRAERTQAWAQHDAQSRVPISPELASTYADFLDSTSWRPDPSTQSVFAEWCQEHQVATMIQ